MPATVSLPVFQARAAGTLGIFQDTILSTLKEDPKGTGISVWLRFPYSEPDTVLGNCPHCTVLSFR